MLKVSKNKKYADIYFEQLNYVGKDLNPKIKSIKLIFPNSASSRKTGLLNHLKLSFDSGIIYKNRFFFHTFGMNFPIGVLCFKDNNNLICDPKVVFKNSVFIAPIGTKYVAEVNHEIVNNFNFERNKMQKNKKITIFNNKCLKIFLNTKSLLILATVLFCFFIIYASYADENIKINLGKERIIDLGSPPQTIQISDPDILDVQRIGVTNSIKLIAKQMGKSVVTISYPDGAENKWNITTGKNSYGGSENQMTAFGLSDASESQGASLSIIAHPINTISGLHTQIKNGKIIILGNIHSLTEFRKLVNFIASKPNLFFPAYTLSKDIENSILKSVQSDLKLFGERDLFILNKGGLYTLNGVPSSPSGKNKSWLFISALIPNIVDATSTMTGDNAIVQVNLEFLEVGKSERIGGGFEQPGMKTPISGGLSFAPSILSSSIAHPTLQIAPLTSLLKALQERSFVRNLAKPVVITRSGEKASFLAGGEVPIVSSSSSAYGQNSSVTYKQFGILFTVFPVVQTDGSIWVKLDLEVSEIDERLSYQNVPGFTSRKVNTNIILKDQNYAILSGLVQTKNSKNVEKFPILGSIPILGELFKSRRFKDDESELWVAISAMRGDIKEDNDDAKKLIEDKFTKYQKFISGSLLD